MNVLGVLMASAVSGPASIQPVLWLNPKGVLQIEGKAASGRLTLGSQVARTPFGLGLELNGSRGGLLVEDTPAMALTRSITVSSWVYLRSYVNDGPGAQIFFRGDDRSGFDPYYLAVLSDGTAQFTINDEEGKSAYALGEVPLERWVHVLGSYDVEMGEVRMFVDGHLVSSRQTSRRPYAPLDLTASPGIGIGNIQNDKGPHNQPINGLIADLRVYSAALEPTQVGWRPLRG